MLVIKSTCFLTFCYNRYGDGAFLSPDDQKAVVEKVLVHHPTSEDKIGCGVDAIMVSQCDFYLIFTRKGMSSIANFFSFCYPVKAHNFHL